jgi:thioredoxin-related protein
MFLTVPAVFSQDQKPDSAQNIINESKTKVKSTNKNILVVFHASWCTWCKWLDKALESPEIKPIMEKYYTIVKIDVKEFGQKIQSLENPGGQKLMEKLDGKSELPFIAVLNKKGKMIANSNMMPKNQNIGYPGSKEEIAAFIKLLKKTAPLMTDKHVVVISNYLKKNAS